MDGPAFNLMYMAKLFKRQSARREKESQKEVALLKKAIKERKPEVAQVRASNAIRKKNESVNLLRLSSRIEAAAARVGMAAQMQQVSKSMAQIVGAMNQASATMDLEKLTGIMDKFESQSENLDIKTKYMEDSMGNTAALTTPQTEIDTLIRQTADEAGLELGEMLSAVQVPRSEPVPEATGLSERLAWHRNAPAA
ncbi:hypothetical protein H4R18_004544 [Coemansia javaensis]|uniref:Uncharacterized protein n=1 Tax=Coemansia javaensis TaxID=2761396 RepID=A0A9W8LFN3_9FUNG|nr:hypothetical protein H4R18_004544 [Coemansia javaensis]